MKNYINKYFETVSENFTNLKGQSSKINAAVDQIVACLKAGNKISHVYGRSNYGAGYLAELFSRSDFFNMTLFGLNVESAERSEIMEEGKLK